MKALSEIDWNGPNGPRDIVVCYHSNCYDGFGAAFAAWKKFGLTAQYISSGYKAPPDTIPATRPIVFVADVSWKRDQMLALRGKCHELVVLDHHDTASKELEGLDFAHFDMQKSGAMLAYEYFHPGQRVPLLIKYLQDRDLWDFKMLHSKEVSAALRSYPFDFKVWEQFLDEEAVHRLAIEGQTILTHQNQIVENICKHHWMVKFEGYDVPVVATSCYFSEVGEKLLELHPECEISMFLIFNRGAINYSLRSDKSKPNFPHVGKLAEKYGGGGHPSAGAFSSVTALPFLSTPWSAT